MAISRTRKDPRRNPSHRRSRFPNRKRQEKRKTAREHITRLLELALANISSEPSLGRRYAELAWKISTRFNVRLGSARILFCHYCKKFIPPGAGSRYRLSRKRKSINVTCLYCGGTHRSIFSPSKAK